MMSRRYQSNSNSKNFFIIILLLIIAGFCYYNFSYLFLKKDSSTATTTAKAFNNPSVKSTINTAPVVNDTFDIAGNTFPVVGTAGHSATGELRIIPLHNVTTIQFEKLNFTPETGLHIYLSKDLTDKDTVDLGLIKGSKGTISYTIPETASPTDRTPAVPGIPCRFAVDSATSHARSGIV